MPWLTLLPMDERIEVESGITLLDAIRMAGIEISAPCNGNGRCGKCKVSVNKPYPGLQNSQEHLTTEEVSKGYRLACQTVVDEDMTITLDDRYTRDARILEGEKIETVKIDPAFEIRSEKNRHILYYRNRDPEEISNWDDAFSPKGLAIDLGTTTLVATLMDLGTGQELATASTVNPQTQYGHDVMTRIQMGSTRKGLRELAVLVSDSLNTLIEKCCNKVGIQNEEIVDVVIGGNTTMLQLAAEIDPSPLGGVPFDVGIDSGNTYEARQFRLNINPRARVYVPPVAHAFVGSDISAGLLSVDFFEQTSPLLFVDIGTNGEMAIIAGGKRLVTSTAAGPAFEGMGISHGMRAAAGAIETVWTNGEYLAIRTIDDAPAKGICGSGIIDTMAALIRSGLVDLSGKMQDPQEKKVKEGSLADRYTVVDGMPSIQLAENVFFTQKDVREFQLAKSAIRTGIEMLLSASGVVLSHLGKIVIAGGFGYHLKPESLCVTGMIPSSFKGEIEFSGNTSRIGCALMLMNAANRDYLQEKMHTVKHLELAGKPEFQARFIENLSFSKPAGN
jgi:uncharacterized 2Fe-2S/4Fe-4S cluster protein (DUF4445 family)